MSKFFAGIATAVLVILIAISGYFLGKGQGSAKEIVEIAPVVGASALPSVTASPVSTPASFVNPTATIAAIKDVISKKNYKDLAPFMAENVNVIIYASSCCGDLTRTEAIDQLKYLDSAKSPWDFDQTSTVVQKLVADVPQYFKDKTIGVAANKYTVAFGLNSKFLISSIVLVVDYTIVAPF